MRELDLEHGTSAHVLSRHEKNSVSVTKSVFVSQNCQSVFSRNAEQSPRFHPDFGKIPVFRHVMESVPFDVGSRRGLRHSFEAFGICRLTVAANFQQSEAKRTCFLGSVGNL